MLKPTEEIKDRLDLVEFIKSYIEVKPAGKNFKAVCPFHQEKTPSFMISPERGIWHCFGCGEGGDIFKFLMRYEGLEFYEALRVLAEKAGIELKKLSPADQKQFGVLYDLNSIAADFFEEALKESEKAMEYVKGRGLKRETLAEFAIGYAPNSADELTLFLINRGHVIDDIVRAGLSLKTERGQYIDRFRGRIMFPIHNHFGKIVGFSSRILPELDNGKVGKYINSPDTPIFNKSRLLYGFWESKKHIRGEEKALLVEGQMDFLLVWQDGVKNVVATSGTALTGDHLRALRRVCNSLVIGFDEDDAGHMAAERSIDLAGGHDFTVYILPLGEFEDPADAAVKKPGYIKEAIGKAEAGMDYYIGRYLTPESMKRVADKKKAIRAVLMKIKTMWSPVERAHWVGELSHRTGIPEDQLIEELERLTAGEGEKPPVISEPAQRRQLERRDLIIEQILSFATGSDKFKKEVESAREFIPEHYKEVFRCIVDGEKGITPGTQRLVDVITLQSGLLFGVIAEDHLEAELNSLLKELKLEQLKEERARVGAEISIAESKDDDNKAEGLLKEFDDILRKMQDIENASQKTEEITN